MVVPIGIGIREEESRIPYLFISQLCFAALSTQHSWIILSRRGGEEGVTQGLLSTLIGSRMHFATTSMVLII